jgi:hypothetical protein
MSTKKLRTIFDLDLVVQIKGTTNNMDITVKVCGKTTDYIMLKVDGEDVFAMGEDVRDLDIIGIRTNTETYISVPMFRGRVRQLIRLEKMTVEKAVDMVINELYIELRILADRLNIQPIDFEKVYRL